MAQTIPTDPLLGYYMAVCITQNETNSQFKRLYDNGFIEHFIGANGVDAGIFGTPGVSSYLRAEIGAPTVKFYDPAHPDDHEQALFLFPFQRTAITPQTLTDALRLALKSANPNAQDSDLNSLNIPDFNAAVDSGDGLNFTLTVNEFVYILNNKVVQKQNLTATYWLQLETQKVGMGTQKNWFLMPYFSFTEGSTPVMVSLDGLQVQLQVLLNSIPTTPADIQAKVDAGLVMPQLANAITNGQFNSSAFSIEQLFIDFDEVDFTQWDLVNVAQSLSTINCMFLANGAWQFKALSYNDLVNNSPKFGSDLSANLQYTFGFNGKNSGGHTPYILGIKVVSQNPVVTNSEELPSFVPTYIGFATTPNLSDSAVNANNGLSTINFQVMGDNKPYPTNNDKTAAYISTNFPSNNDYSGTLVLSKQVFFDKMIATPVANSLGNITPFAYQGNNVFSSKNDFSNHATNDEDWSSSNTDDYQSIGVAEAAMSHILNQDYTLTINGNQIVLSGNYYYALYWAMRIPGGDWNRGANGFGEVMGDVTCTFTKTLTLGVDATSNGIKATLTSPDPTITKTPAHATNAGGQFDKAILDFESTVTMGALPSLDDAFNKQESNVATYFQDQITAINNNLLKGMQSNFISPTGQVFDMANPRFNEAFDLLIDITYRV